jgi:hypothetical protein
VQEAQADFFRRQRGEAAAQRVDVIRVDVAQQQRPAVACADTISRSGGVRRPAAGAFAAAADARRRSESAGVGARTELLDEFSCSHHAVTA